MQQPDEIEVVLKLSRFQAGRQIAERGEKLVVADALRSLADQIEAGKGFGIVRIQSNTLAQVGFFHVRDRDSAASQGEPFLDVPGVWGRDNCSETSV